MNELIERLEDLLADDAERAGAGENLPGEVWMALYAREAAVLLDWLKHAKYAVEFARARFCDPAALDRDPAAARLKEMADRLLGEGN